MITPAQDLIKKLNRRAVKASADKLKEANSSLTSRNSILLGTPSSGWYYSWYVVRTDDKFGIHALHEDLHVEANELLERGSRENEQIILMSAYMAAIVTYTDSCRTMLHHYLPPFLHPTLKEMGIGTDLNTKPYPFPLNPQEQEGREILYSYALLEMTGT